MIASQKMFNNYLLTFFMLSMLFVVIQSESPENVETTILNKSPLQSQEQLNQSQFVPKQYDDELKLQAGSNSFSLKSNEYEKMGQMISKDRKNLQSRLLTTCSNPDCIYCAVLDKERCFLCKDDKLPLMQGGICLSRTEFFSSLSLFDPSTQILSQSCTIENCDSCLNLNIASTNYEYCAQCKQGYRLAPIQGLCISFNLANSTQQEGIISLGMYYMTCPEGCSVCSSVTLGVCISCSTGYVMRGFGILSNCVKCLENCLTCSDLNSSQCLSCHPGFVLSNGNCLKCTSSSCSQCQQLNTTQCTSCQNSFLTVSGSCQNCPSNCKTCSTNLTCDVCNQGYLQVTAQNGSSTCMKCIFGCYECISLSTCRFCYPGHFQNSENKCEACGQNCRVCLSRENCTLCHTGYDLFNGKCIKRVKNCNLMNSNGKCLVCKVSFQMSPNGVCDANFTEIAFQFTYLTFTQTIKICQTKYYLQNNTCTKCVQKFPNCEECSASTYCTKCLDGYYQKIMFTGQCLQCPQNECKKCQSEDVCLECLDGYYLLEESDSINGTNTKSNGQCMRCDENCKTCSINKRTCTSCQNNRILSLENNCESQYQLAFAMSFDFNYQTAGQKLNVIRSSLAECIPAEAKLYQEFNELIALAIKFLKIYRGSTNVQGYVDLPSRQTADTMLSTVNQVFAQGRTIGSLPVLSSTFTIVKRTNNPDEGESQSNLGLILGLTIGSVALIGIGIFLVYKFKISSQTPIGIQNPGAQHANHDTQQFDQLKEHKNEKLEISNQYLGN